MKRISFLMVVVMVVSLLGVPVFADGETTYYTEAEVMSGAALGKSIDFTSQTLDNLLTIGTFSNYKNNTGVTSHSVDADGLKMISSSTGKYSAGFKPSGFNNTLGVSGGIKLTFKTDGQGQFQMNFQSTADNMRVRFYMADGKLGYYGQADGDVNVQHRTFGEALAANTWHTYIIKKEGTKIAYYKQASDGRYEKVISYTPGLATSDAFEVCNCVATDTSVTIKELSMFYDTKETFLGDNVALWNCLDFDENVDGFNNGARMAGDNAAKNISNADGLNLYNLTTGDSAITYAVNGFYILTGASVEVRAKVESGATWQFNIGDRDSAQKHRARMVVDSTGVQFIGGGANGSTYTNYGFSDTTLCDKWVTYIIKNEGENFKLWIDREGNGGYGKYAAVTKTKNNADLNELQMVNSSKDKKVYIDYIKTYKAGDTNVPTDANMRLMHDGDFSKFTDLSAKQIMLSDVNTPTLENGKLKLTAVAGDNNTVSSGSYASYYSAIPLGGYMELSYKSDAKLDITMRYNGTDMVYRAGLTADTVNYTSYDGTNATWPVSDSGIFHVANNTHIYRIAHNQDGTYTAWHSFGDGTGWIKVFDNINPRTTTISDMLYLSLATQGSANIDYVKVYAPKSDAKLIVTDGRNATKEVSATVNMRHGSELRAIVPAGNTGKLLVAVYDANNTLIDIKTKDITDDSADTEYVCDVSSGKTAKVYLWKDLSNLEPVCGSVEAKIK